MSAVPVRKPGGPTLRPLPLLPDPVPVVLPRCHRLPKRPISDWHEEEVRGHVAHVCELRCRAEGRTAVRCRTLLGRTPRSRPPRMAGGGVACRSLRRSR
eukprot:6340531-Pyramimonas_sp.AAC.1